METAWQYITRVDFGAFLSHPLITWPAWFLLAVLVVWAWYLALTPLKRAHDSGVLYKLSPPVVALAYALLIGFLIADALFNAVASFVFYLTYPRDVLFTSTCERYLPQISWRGRVARWLCANMLDPFDPSGRHCRGKRA